MGWGGSSSTTQSTVSPEQRSAQGTAMNWGLWAAQQPYQAYGGPLTAGFRPELQKAGQMFYDAPGVGAGNINTGAGMVQQAGNTPVAAGQTTARNSTGFGGDQFMGRYFNPFLQQVGGQMVSDMGRARDMQIQGDEDKALAAGAYGGSRHGVADAETTRGYYDRLGANLGQLYSRGFDTAAGLGQQDAQRFTDVDRANADRTLNSDQGNVNRSLSADEFNVSTKMQAGQSLAGIGDMQHDNFAGDASNLMGYGSAVQNYDQAAIDRSKAAFDDWRNYPARQSDIINRSAGLVQGGGTQTVTQQPNRMQGMMSGAMTGAMIGSAVPVVGTGVGAAAGGLMGLIGSDRNIKSDIRELGSDDQVLRGIKKTPVSTWRYDPKKGGPNDGGAPHIGPMAQDVKRNLGIGDGRAMPTVDVLGAHHAAIRSLAKKVDAMGITDVKIKRKVKAKGK